MKPYKPRSLTPDENRLVWLLDFMQRDLTTLRPGEQIDLLDDCVKLLGWRDPAVIVLPPDPYAIALATRAGVRRDLPWPEAEVVAVQAALKAGVELLEAGRSWQPFDTAQPPIFTVQADKTVVRRYEAGHEASMTASAVDLLVTFWPRIDRCQLPSCHRLFLREDGRQRFHDPQCANLARSRKPRNYAQEQAAAEYHDEQLKKKAKKKHVVTKKEKQR